MRSVSQLGYIGIGVTDLAAWEDFATEIVGFEVAERAQDGALFLRMDEPHHRLVIHPGGNDDVAYFGWEVQDAATLDAVAEQIRAAGAPVTKGTQAESEARRVVALVKFRDPNGIASEIFYGPLIAPQKFRSPRPISGFKTGALGLGHFVLLADNLEKSIEFYSAALGFRVSDYLTGLPFRLGFMRCNGRHHSAAFAEVPNPPKRLNHIMVELNSVDDVCATYYLCQDREVPIDFSLGRHINDNMFSFYMKTPSGFNFEYGWDGRIVDDSTWQVQLHPQHQGLGSAWGHRQQSR